MSPKVNTLSTNAAKVAAGGVVLVARQILVAFSSAGVGIVLARKLSTAEFGMYAVVTLIMTSSYLLVEAGFSAAAVQHREVPTRRRLAVVYGAQLSVAVVLAGLLVGLNPSICAPFHDVRDARACIYLCAIGVVFVPFSTIGVIQLERALRLAESGALLAVRPIVFNVVAAIAALSGLRVVGLGVAFLASSVSAVPYVLWRVGMPPLPSFAFREIRDLWRFAWFNAMASLVNALKDAANPLVIGLVVGATAVGRVNWAQQVAVLGTYLVMVFSRLLLPAFARMQSDRVRMGQAAEQVLFWLNAVTALVVCGTLASISSITTLIYGDRWTAAIPLVCLLSVANVLTPASIVCSGLLNATGSAAVVFKAALGWLAATWVGVLVLVPMLGENSYGYANIAAQGVTVWLIVKTRSEVAFRPVRSIAEPWIASGICFCLASVLVGRFFDNASWARLVAVSVSGAAGFAVLIVVLSRKRINWFLLQLRGG
ncbi:oligosaccharide flippase family protein [Nocardioides sp. BP30]|uniref:oligosaccharide flippase family protein n=1 Tax=Nocardioides sp. BP30 TaxID=3036374 RepID=UPI002469270F|nr:oligosaccharide flippase family protein [Nocardioides sp. BP30]WGL52053.1 oligosaccharide flippase family protein [Nocardioides sp. BP30]